MNARIASIQASVTASLNDEATQRKAIAYISASLVSWALASIAYACLSYVLWAWLAFVIAAVASLVAGRYVVSYMRADGYDHAVNTCAAVKGFFTKLAAPAPIAAPAVAEHDQHAPVKAMRTKAMRTKAA